MLENDQNQRPHFHLSNPFTQGVHHISINPSPSDYHHFNATNCKSELGIHQNLHLKRGAEGFENQIQVMMKNPELFTSSFRNKQNNNNSGSSNMIPPFKNPDDLYFSLRFLLVFGRILGVIPLMGLFQSSSHFLQFKWKSQAAIYCLTICCALVFTAFVNAWASFKSTSSSPSDLAWSCNLIVYYSIGSFTYMYFISHARRFIELFKRWRELVLYFDGVDRHIKRDVNIMVAVLYTSCILEHAYAHLKFFPIVKSAERRLASRPDLVARLENSSIPAWEVYYWRSHPFVGDIIPYSMTAALFFFLMSKYCILSWNFCDILVAAMSRALYYRFRMLNEQAHLLLIGNGVISRDTEKWKQLTRDHETLCDITAEFEELLSPLIFALYGVNIYYFCIQFSLGLTPSANNTAIASIYAVWSFLHLSARILVVSITASNIHVNAQRTLKIIKKCPIECFTVEVDRAERSIRESKIGLSGLGCFNITRNFILNIVNTIFTFEIVLLTQTQSPETETGTSPK